MRRLEYELALSHGKSQAKHGELRMSGILWIEKDSLRTPSRGECQTLPGTSSYQRSKRNRLSAIIPIGLCRSRTIRLSAHIWLAVMTRCAARSQNISAKDF